MEKKLKATCRSPANIAFIKYWGKADPKTRVPQNNSISMCLSDLYTICTIEFSKKFPKDKISFLNEKVVTEKELQRIIDVLDRVRKLAGLNFRARMVTKNNFPKTTGIASSASGLSSVTMAACAALGLKMNQKELSKLSRLASGSASRSIPDGFVEWKKGTNKNDSYAVQIFPPGFWQISDVVVIVTHRMKKISSSSGHKLADTSPFQKERIRGMPTKVKTIKKAIQTKDFAAFGSLLEQEALNMHAICLTSQPSILYWAPTTIEIIKKIQKWKEDSDLESYFTIDAGSTVHVICQSKNEVKLVARLKKIKGVDRIVINHPSIGARIISKHLF